jgi:hypothetical protein
MRFPWLVVLFVTVASLLSLETQQQPAPKSEPAKMEPAPTQEQAAKPADSGPPVDTAKVTGSTFESQYFKFTYEFPKGWKTLDDVERVADNRRLSEEDKERSTARLPAPKKGWTKVPVKKNPALALPPTSAPEHYSLMVASPNGVPSLASPVLPRINVWAHKRVPPLDTAADHAQLLLSGKRTKVLVPPREVTLGGHSFVCVNVITPSGTYQSQFVAVLGDYLVGFDFRAESQREMEDMANTMNTIKFR